MRDLIGVGIGPFNLGLAALLDDHDVDAVFFERQPRFGWHEGLMVDGAELQVPFLADLVTLADPTSRWSFLNYLHERGRLYRFYFHERLHVLRREYAAYCRWVADALPACVFGTGVAAITALDGGWRVTLADGTEHAARHVAVGIGQTPWLPPCARDHAVHSSGYLGARAALLAKATVAVIGSGQSAAEIVLDLLRAGVPALRWFTRGDGFLPMEYSKLGLEHFTPEYTAYFHGLDHDRRETLRAGQDLLYRGISADTSAAIYDELYARSVDGGEPDVEYRARCELVGVDAGPVLTLRQLDQDRVFTVPADALVCATGYEPAPLPVADLGLLAELDPLGRPVVGLDYRVRGRDGEPLPLFVQNAELHTHGVGAPDLGLGAHRNAVIANTLLGRAAYPVRDRTVFQRFGAP